VPDGEVPQVTEALQIGDSGSEVAELQQRLADLGYQIPVSGSYDEQTYEAVKSYQQYCGVEVTGVADTNTLSYLEAHASTAAQGTYHQDQEGYEHAGHGQGYDHGGHGQEQHGDGYDAWGAQLTE